jgi:hypothetical protein
LILNQFGQGQNEWRITRLKTTFLFLFRIPTKNRNFEKEFGKLSGSRTFSYAFIRLKSGDLSKILEKC